MTDTNIGSHEKMTSLYYNVKLGFKPVRTFITLFNKMYPDENVTNDEIETFVKQQEVDQVMRKKHVPMLYSTVLAKCPKHIYQIDIMVYDRYTIHHYKYVLNCIDVYSRFLMSKPLTNKRTTTVLQALENMFQKNGYPEEVSADQEFNTHELNRFFKNHHIKTFFSRKGEINKNALVERVHGTLAKLLQKIRIGTGNKKWYQYLQDAVDNYNGTVHSTVKHAPKDIFTNKVASGQTRVLKVPHSFVKGDRVRVLQIKDAFSKGDENSYSKTVYDVHKVDGEKILLKNEHNDVLNKRFKPYELLKISKISKKSKIDPQEEKEHRTLERKLKKLKKELT